MAYGFFLTIKKIVSIKNICILTYADLNIQKPIIFKYLNYYRSEVMEIQKQDINEMFKEMVDEAVAFAIVGKDGQVAYSYAQNIKINFDPHDASHILKMIAQLSDTRDRK